LPSAYLVAKTVNFYTTFLIWSKPMQHCTKKPAERYVNVQGIHWTARTTLLTYLLRYSLSDWHYKNTNIYRKLL